MLRRRRRAAKLLPICSADPDSLRELVHEIKTPLNAIIGFAEIIEGQYLGPADHRYRERAGEIVAQARLLLGAIDDLDFAAKIHSSARRRTPRRPVTPVRRSSATRCGKRRPSNGVAAGVGHSAGAIASRRCEPEIADRLIGRFAEAVIDQAAAGERLRISVDQR